MKRLRWLILAVVAGALAVFLLFRSPPPEPRQEAPGENAQASPAPRAQPNNPYLPPAGDGGSSAPKQDPAPPIASEPSPPTEKGESLRKDQPPPPPLKDVLLKDAHGTPLFLDQETAMKTCAEHGMRLPTIRELALLGQARGAKGILEVSQVRDQDEINGYMLVHPLPVNGKADNFYYNPAGYADSLRGLADGNKLVGTRALDGRNIGRLEYIPPGWEDTRQEARHLIYWSSSRGQSPNDLPVAYVFDIDGNIHGKYLTLPSLVRCVVNP